MRPERIIPHSCALAAVALIALPAVAQAGSTLSGYGGPGEGSQAVLGSALIGGHRGGGSGGSGGPGSAAGAEAQPSAGQGEGTAASGATGAGAGSAAATGAGTGARGRAGGAGSSAGTGAKSSPSRASGSGAATTHSAHSVQNLYPAAERVPASGQGTVLGLTGADLLYAIGAAAILVLLGVLTWRMGDSPPRTRSGG